MKTERAFQLALSNLLDRLKVHNKWNKETFVNLANASGISKAEACRFYKALVDMNLLYFDKNCRSMKTQFNINIWQNEDSKLLLIKEIMDMFPELQQPRGRVKGKVYVKKEEKSIASYSAQELVDELRSRGYIVEAYKEIITREEL